jgi:hypothetical protein
MSAKEHMLMGYPTAHKTHLATILTHGARLGVLRHALAVGEALTNRDFKLTHIKEDIMATDIATKGETIIPQDSQEEAFKFQLEMIKMEIDFISQGLARFDENGRQTKYWAIITWAGSIALALGQGLVQGQQDFRRYIIFTAIIPLVFWLVDSRWTSLIRAFVYRLDKISEFLNDPRFIQSFERRQLVGFTLLDPRARQYRKSDEYKKTVTFWRALMAYREVSVFYLGLAGISLAVGAFFICTSIS